MSTKTLALCSNVHQATDEKLNIFLCLEHKIFIKYAIFTYGNMWFDEHTYTTGIYC